MSQFGENTVRLWDQVPTFGQLSSFRSRIFTARTICFPQSNVPANPPLQIPYDMKTLSRALSLALLVTSVAGAQGSSLSAKVESYRKAHDVEIVRELSDFLAIRNL